MTVLVAPLAPYPSGESWRIANADLSGGPSLTGIEQVVSSGAGFWRARMTYQVKGAAIRPWRALLAGLDGRAGTFLIGPRARLGKPAVPVGGVISASLGLAAPLRATQVTVAMASGGAPGVGAYLGIGQRLHLITSVAPTASANTYLCGIRPGLRAAVSAGGIVDFTAPTCLMRLATPDTDPALSGPRWMDLTLDLVEAL